MESSNGNTLIPVFFRPDKMKILIVGGGNVGFEKSSFLFRHAPESKIHIVSETYIDDVIELQKKYPNNISLETKSYDSSDLEGFDIVLGATNIRSINEVIHKDAKAKGLIVNIADTPDLCDFYLSSVVKKGDLKIAISSNGKSPTITKRVREVLDDALPDEIDEIIASLKDIRDQLKGDFEYKVKKLDEITASFKPNEKP